MKSEKGMVSLEACITVLFFMVIMFLLSGLFIMYMAQNATAHALLQTSQSLALDNYAASEIGTGDFSSFKDLMVKILGDKIGFIPDANSSFATNEELSKKTADIPAMAEKRFIAYLAGGDRDKADTMLRQMKVENGIDGLNFSESKVEGSDLKIVLTYELNYVFQIAELGKVEVRQETSSKLWE